MPIPPRYPLEINAFSPLLGSLATENISQSGVALRILAPDPRALERKIEGELIDLELKLEGNTSGLARVIAVRARVVWHKGDCFGVHFSTMTTEDRKLIESMLSQYAALCKAMAALHSAA